MADTLTDAAKFWTKIAEVASEATRIPKLGRNTEQKYDYVRSVDVVDTIRELIRAAKLAYGYEVIDSTLLGATPKGTQLVTQVMTRHWYIDTETGYERSFLCSGQGADFGDKGTYKAQTGAEKYHLCKMFLLPTGDDPDEDTGDAHTEGRTYGGSESAGDSATEKQIKTIWAVKHKLEMSDEQLYAGIRRDYPGKEHPDQLTKREASALIDKMQGALDAKGS